MKALLISPNEKETTLLRNLVGTHFSRVPLMHAANKEAAAELLSSDGPFSLIVIDYEIKDEPLEEILEIIHDLVGEPPILLLGHEHNASSMIPEEHYVQETYPVLNRPIDVQIFLDHFKEAVDSAKDDEYEKSIQDLDISDLLPMRLRNFYLYKEIDYHAYVEITSTKFARIISANEPYSEGHIRSYAQKGVKFLYLQKNDYVKMLEQNLARIKNSLQADSGDLRKDLKFQVLAVGAVHEYLKNVGITDYISEYTNELVELCMATFGRAKSFRKILAAFPDLSLEVPMHAVLTFYVGEMILQGLTWQAPITRTKMGISAILHEVHLPTEGMLLIETLNGGLAEGYSEEDRELLKDHPTQAAEMVQMFPQFPEVSFLIQHHHELPNGSGFPQGLHAIKLTALTASFNMASKFAARLLSNGQKSFSFIYRLTNEFKVFYDVGTFKEPVAAMVDQIKNEFS